MDNQNNEDKSVFDFCIKYMPIKTIHKGFTSLKNYYGKKCFVDPTDEPMMFTWTRINSAMDRVKMPDGKWCRKDKKWVEGPKKLIDWNNLPQIPQPESLEDYCNNMVDRNVGLIKEKALFVNSHGLTIRKGKSPPHECRYFVGDIVAHTTRLDGSRRLI